MFLFVHEAIKIVELSGYIQVFLKASKLIKKMVKTAENKIFFNVFISRLSFEERDWVTGDFFLF